MYFQEKIDNYKTKSLISLTSLAAALVIAGCSSETLTTQIPSTASTTSANLAAPPIQAPVISSVRRKGGSSLRPNLTIEVIGANFTACEGSFVTFGVVTPVGAVNQIIAVPAEEFTIVNDSLIIVDQLPRGATRFSVTVTNECGSDSTPFLLLGIASSILF
ncbi:MAG: hypothetical protein NW237_06825 [Cyanobacteriota bacterium]|nr:hypothetical protein [Cyanobacteriota bacterium]